MYKIAVMGDYDSIYGFATLGLDTFPVQDSQEAAQILNRLVESQYGIVYMTEGCAAGIEHEVLKYQEQLSPAIILIPGIAGNTGKGIENVKKSVEQAVGSDILFAQNS